MRDTPLGRAVEAAKAWGVTEQTILKTFDISPHTLRAWISGVRTPTVQVAIKLARLLRKTVEDLFGED